ncbi:chemotaxis protein CheW [Paraburkholderia sp. SARCC-3016]|jgi:chemotaxis-related protein WspD|uniref:chemotaxis protein CheW n=1 Tax=Paraburkholderia sp. SARCC-3016 TaxID=3058611 RepID=UPI00280774F3|nr:chemotaxis protein CheW [Paraburkholderia sp. SARCC-3016]MDQ7977972.1 chemotaxis protein CheW [Paraburkholderia sp. SARCC-3016]
MTERVDDLPDIASSVDDCWNRIGTRGDQSCPALAEWTRCLNCPVFERAAARLLDRPVSDALGGLAADVQRVARLEQPAGVRAEVATASGSGDSAAGASAQSSETDSVVVFRVADEWLALPTKALKQIEDLRPVHSLPHRRNRVVLGLVNVRGALTVVVSLGELLRLDRTVGAAAASHPGAGETSALRAPRSGRYARMLVVAHDCEPVVFPVDEVHGVVRYAAGALKPVPDTLTRSSAAHAAGVLAWQGKTVGVLDAARVFASLTQSLQ